jgi:hypothetical protein
LKYWVAALSPPLQIFRTSWMLIAPMASPKIFFAPGAAASAARFMERTNSSSWGP